MALIAYMANYTRTLTSELNYANAAVDYFYACVNAYQTGWNSGLPAGVVRAQPAMPQGIAQTLGFIAFMKKYHPMVR